ncbi:hypothetical protein K1719_014348 [Acacia pycnantha]|nr:hypothetical protein K1719_014348 [Acacia pycnantha]
MGCIEEPPKKKKSEGLRSKEGIYHTYHNIPEESKEPIGKGARGQEPFKNKSSARLKSRSRLWATADRCPAVWGFLFVLFF